MATETLGARFEHEIGEQPLVWERIAESDKASSLARVLTGEVVLVGSGSSLFVAELGALALRRRGIPAQALAATEAKLDHNAYQHKIVVAISQSGRSTDLLHALDMLSPRFLVALTNTPSSPLADRAHLAIDVGAGREQAVPASKSVSATVAILLWAASLAGGDSTRDAATLKQAATAIGDWLRSPSIVSTIEAAHRIATRTSVVVLGSDYGWPVAREMALKLKEASYLHAEGFAAGEFRHGSVAMVDASTAVVGIVDDDALPIVQRPMRETAESGALRFSIGACAIDDVPRLGPAIEDPYNTLAWLVTAQMIALHAARARRVDADAPRGLTKALVEETG